MAAQMNRRKLLQSGMAALPLLAARPAPAAAPIQLPGPVRVGLIGLDGHFSEATDAAKLLPGIEITAVAVTSERERRRSAGNAQLAKAKIYNDYRSMLDGENLDVICLCDRNDTRAEAVLACLDRKIPTAAEKPMALSLADLGRVRERQAATKTPLTMLLPMRFDSHYLAMKAIVGRGEIGEPIALAAQKSYQLGERADWMKERSSFGGTIPYIGIHVVDLLRFISGRDMVEAAAFHANVGFAAYGEMENNATISYRLDNGGTASVRLDYLRPEAAGSHGDDRLRVAGSDGVVEYQQGEVTLITDSKKPHRVTELPEHTPLFVDFLETRDAADQRRVVQL
jgi:predicted dehydrogenase